MKASDSNVSRVTAVRTHAAVTLLLGALYLGYHALWLGSSEAPFATPNWLVTAQLSWGLLSFGMIFLYQRDDRSPVLPALYVTFTGATYSYVWYLEVSRGSVSDEMVPGWWKVLAASVGLVLFVEGLRQMKLKRLA